MKAKSTPKDSKTIEVRIRFYTDKINKDKTIMPKHCWDMGLVYVPNNDLHGISHVEHHFDSLCELPKIIEDMLIEAEIKVHRGNRAKKYTP